MKYHRTHKKGKKKEKEKMAMVLLIPLLVFSALFTISSSTYSPQPGICYGQLGNNLPPLWKSVELIKSLKAKRVKIYYYASPQILNALKNTTFQVSILVSNKLISSISTILTLRTNVGSTIKVSH